MLILIAVLLVIIAILLLWLFFRLCKWILKSKRRVQVFLAVLVVGGAGMGIHHFFFKKMQFIRSNVYSNLYLVEYPNKEYSIVENAIKEKIKEHLKTEQKTGKPLSYSGENAIYFYELGGRTFGFIGEAGTGYFIDHEEDLGGFVSEELGMYTNYRLAEFYYDPCPEDSTVYCGEINHFREGEFFKVDNLKKLLSVSVPSKKRIVEESFESGVDNENPDPIDDENTEMITETKVDATLFSEFHPKKVESPQIDKFHVEQTFKLNGYKIVTGSYEPNE